MHRKWAHWQRSQIKLGMNPDHQGRFLLRSAITFGKQKVDTRFHKIKWSGCKNQKNFSNQVWEITEKYSPKKLLYSNWDVKLFITMNKENKKIPHCFCNIICVKNFRYYFPNICLDISTFKMFTWALINTRKKSIKATSSQFSTLFLFVEIYLRRCNFYLA